MKTNPRPFYLTALRDIGAELGRAANFSELLIPILDQLIDLSGADRAYLLQLQEESAVHDVLVVRQAGGRPAGGDIEPPGRDLIEQAISTGQAVSRVDDGVQHSPTSPGQPGSILVAPLLVSGRGSAILCLESQDRIAFSAEETLFLEAVANQLALALTVNLLQDSVQAVSIAKNEYISLVTHQLRVPLTSISGYTDMLLTGVVGPLNEKQESFLQTVKRNAGRMNILIQDMSEINRLESGRVSFHPQVFDLTNLIDEVIRDLQPALETRQQEMAVDISPELPMVYADRPTVGRVLALLVDNASLYTPESGIITLVVDNNGEAASVQVADTGIGISNADQAHLFTPFFRSEDERVRQHPGWGLGLALAKKLAAAQSGTITFRSRLGEGSTFIFTIPLALGNQTTPNSV